LGSALQAVDDALRSAADITVKKTSKEVDEKFERAIEVLSHYETECHPKKPVSRDGHPMTVLGRMGTAKAKDKSSSTILNGWKEKLSLKVRSAPITPPRAVLTTTTRQPRRNNQNRQRSSSFSSSSPCQTSVQPS